MNPDEQMPHAATPVPGDDRPPDVEVETPADAPDGDANTEDEATDLDLTKLPDLRGDGP